MTRFIIDHGRIASDGLRRFLALLGEASEVAVRLHYAAPWRDDRPLRSVRTRASVGRGVASSLRVVS